MSHYITIPINANGIIFDTTMNDVVREAMAVDPFGFEDVYIYSHGWSTDADGALDQYNKFTVDLARLILISEKQNPHAFSAPPKDMLGMGIHWPSEITEDPASPLNDVQLLTFYTMEHRADAVGKNAVYTMLRLILGERVDSGVPLRIFMVGHSFGSKVMLAALQDLQVDIADGTIEVPPNTSFSVALLEAATDNDNLEPGDIYGEVFKIQNLRLLLSKSSLDAALGRWFPLAGKLANLLHPAPTALGYGGPTAATCVAAVFGAPYNVDVIAGFTAANLRGVDNRLIVADLSSVHQSRVAAGLWSGGVSGSHSDISFAEIYELLCGFFYRP